jgi:hypothetical protein
MASLTKEQRAELIRSLRFDAGAPEFAENDRNFYPVAEHLRALDPSVVLVVGDRGAGKTKLVQLTKNAAQRVAISKRFPHLRTVMNKTEWRDGHPLHSEGPDARGWQAFAEAHGADRTAMQELWFAYLIRVIADRLDTEAKEGLADLLSCPGGDTERCFTEFKKAGTAALLAVDRLDKALEQEDAWLFVSYDELDTILYSDWGAMGVVIRGLISFWATYARRFRRVRAKLFLRTDLYRHHSDVTGADIAKVAANRVDLSWSDKNLYGVLIQHIANTSNDLLTYAQKAVQFEEEDSELGHIPKLLKKEDARPFVERMIGKYMGANESKGQSFTWILDHLRDANGKASPRSLVLLIEFAAEFESGTSRASGSQILHPISLRNALDRVSEQYVSQAGNELLWLPGLKERLAKDREVSWQRKELETLLRARWDENWSLSQADVRPPADNPRELVDYLMELGIVRHRAGDSYDVPDLFLKGLGLTRKGGVARGKHASVRRRA